MTQGALNQQSTPDRLLRMVLTAALIFAVWHVTSHDIGTSNDVSDHTCQMCRLNHVPVADLPVFSWIVPLFVINLLFVTPVVQRSTQSYRYTLGARAPPLS